MGRAYMPDLGPWRIRPCMQTNKTNERTEHKRYIRVAPLARSCKGERKVSQTKPVAHWPFVSAGLPFVARTGQQADKTEQENVTRVDQTNEADGSIIRHANDY